MQTFDFVRMGSAGLRYWYAIGVTDKKPRDISGGFFTEKIGLLEGMWRKDGVDCEWFDAKAFAVYVRAKRCGCAWSLYTVSLCIFGNSQYCYGKNRGSSDF